MQVFRVIRLFKKLESMRIIVTSLTHAAIPVLNAFLIMLLFTCMYAVFAVTLYGEKMPEHFGRFSAAFFTVHCPKPALTQLSALLSWTL